MQRRFYHEPVLVREVLAGLCVAAGKRYIDATLGGGGHAKEILRCGGIVLGLDTDPDAIEENKNAQMTIVQGNFRDIEAIAKEHGFGSVDGVLFDLGVSSHQIDTKDRGFSYRFPDAPIDMRMDQSMEISANELVNHASQQELYEIFTTYGEEERAGAISALIVRARSIKPIHTVGELVRIVGTNSSVLSRLFQALRIAVNDELSVLKKGLIGAQNLSTPGGRLAVISFHSLEDRIVKQCMQKAAWREITKKPIVPTKKEMQENRRARSAKLRIAEYVGNTA